MEDISAHTDRGDMDISTSDTYNQQSLVMLSENSSSEAPSGIQCRTKVAIRDHATTEQTGLDQEAKQNSHRKWGPLRHNVERRAQKKIKNELAFGQFLEGIDPIAFPWDPGGEMWEEGCSVKGLTFKEQRFGARNIVRTE